MSGPIVVTIPGTPPRSLSPNGRANPFAKNRDAQALKSAAFYATYNAHLELWEPVLPLTLHWLIAWGKGQKRWDDDNAIAGLKAARDGIALALGIDDRNMVTGSMNQDRDPAGIGYVRVAIEQSEPTP